MSGGLRGRDSSVALLERFVLASFGSAASLSRSELEERTGLSRHVMAAVVTELVAQGELVETRQLQGSGARGRPAARYARAALLAPVLLIRLRYDGATSVTSVCSDGARSGDRACTPWSAPWQAWSRSVADAQRQLRVQPRLAVLSVPFPVAEGRGAPPTRGIPADSWSTGGRTPPRPPWLERDPRTALSELFGYPALMVNDANLAALGEARFGAGRGMHSVMHMSVVQGIGAGLIVDGRLFTGAHGFSGELAHVQVRPDGPLCACGNRGCLATAAGLRSEESGAAARGYPELGPLIGQALAPFITAFDPDCLVIDSRLGNEAASFVAGLAAELVQRCSPLLTDGLTILTGSLDDAELYGALAVGDAHAVVPHWESSQAGYAPVGSTRG